MSYAMMQALKAPGLPRQTTRVLYAYLVGRANGARVTWPSNEEIMADLNIATRQTVSTEVHELQNRGLIRIQRKMRVANHYHILDPDGRLYGDQKPQSDVVHSRHQGNGKLSTDDGELSPDVAPALHQRGSPQATSDVAPALHPDVAPARQEESSKKVVQESSKSREAPPPVPDAPLERHDGARCASPLHQGEGAPPAEPPTPTTLGRSRLREEREPTWAEIEAERARQWAELAKGDPAVAKLVADFARGMRGALTPPRLSP